MAGKHWQAAILICAGVILGRARRLIADDRAHIRCSWFATMHGVALPKAGRMKGTHNATKANSPPAASRSPARAACILDRPKRGPTAVITAVCTTHAGVSNGRILHAGGTRLHAPRYVYQRCPTYRATCHTSVILTMQSFSMRLQGPGLPCCTGS